MSFGVLVEKVSLFELWVEKHDLVKIENLRNCAHWNDLSLTFSVGHYH